MSSHFTNSPQFDLYPHQNVKIVSLSISRLYNIFDYSIAFTSIENVLIITGANGFGKTMILNVIHSLFNKRFEFFRKLVFNKLEIILSNGFSITVDRLIVQPGTIHLSIACFRGQQEIERVMSTSDLGFEAIRQIQRYLPFARTDRGVWFDTRSGKETQIEDILHEYADQLPPDFTQKIVKFSTELADRVFDSIQVHLIKEQRLFKKVLNPNIQRREYREDSSSIMTETIKAYASELKDLIAAFSQRSFFETQKLDSSYPLRLTNEKNILTKDEYEARYNILKDKQEKLKKFGLYESKQEFLNYTNEDAKALSVYLKDFEIKLSVFDDLLQKLELFTEILNERRFTYKSIQINRDKGFYFRTQTGEDLELDQLSSGEQHEVVLLYELIFNVKANVLVLIDEPEISLHVSWQKEFLNDLLRIIKIQNVQVIVATHSPAIINDRWDLVFNLQNPNTLDGSE